MVQGEEYELVETITNEADHGKLGKLTAGVAFAAFGECPQAIERKVLHNRRDKAACVGNRQWQTQKLDQEIEDKKIGDRASGPNHGKFNETFHFFAVGTSKL